MGKRRRTSRTGLLDQTAARRLHGVAAPSEAPQSDIQVAFGSHAQLSEPAQSMRRRGSVLTPPSQNQPAPLSNRRAVTTDWRHVSTPQYSAAGPVALDDENAGRQLSLGPGSSPGLRLAQPLGRSFRRLPEVLLFLGDVVFL